MILNNNKKKKKKKLNLSPALYSRVQLPQNELRTFFFFLVLKLG